MIHFIQHGLRDCHSHFYGETLGFLQAARELNVGLQVWTHAKCEPEILAACNAKAVFPLQTDGVLDLDPVSAELSSYIVGATAFAGILSKYLTTDISAVDWVFVAYASQNEAYALALWLQTLPSGKRPQVALFCHRPELKWNIGPQREKMSANASFWRFAALIFEKIGIKDRVHVFAPDARLANVLAMASGLQVQTTGIATPYFLTPEQVLEVPKKFDIGLIGEFRSERGSDLVPDLMVELDQQRPGMRYVLQLRTANETGKVRRRLADKGFAGELLLVPSTMLEPAEFARLIPQMRLMVLPYFPDRYRMRSSGVLSECIAYATPCVVPVDTWLGDQVQSGAAAGVVFAEWTSQAICAATLNALDQLNALSDSAKEKMQPWRQQNCARAMLERLV